MRYSELLDRLQKLTNHKPSQAELCNVLNIKQSAMSNRFNRDSDFSSDEIVIRAISELHKEGLIISERKYTNRYKYTARFLSLLGISNNKMQVNNFQNKIKETCKMQAQLIEQTKEPINKPTNVDDFKILKDYAVKHNAKNINAYINFLKKSGSDKQIIKDYKQSKANNKAMLESVKRNQESLEYARQNAWEVPQGFFESIRNQIQKSPIPEQIRG